MAFLEHEIAADWKNFGVGKPVEATLNLVEKSRLFENRRPKIESLRVKFSYN